MYKRVLKNVINIRHTACAGHRKAICNAEELNIQHNNKGRLRHDE